MARKKRGTGYRVDDENVAEAGKANGLRPLFHWLFTKIPEITLNALGFLIALIINNSLEDRKEIVLYNSMLTALRAEASSNLQEGIFEDRGTQILGLAVLDYNYSTSSLFLANPTFIKHTSSSNIETLSSYVRSLALANGYSHSIQTLSKTRCFGPYAANSQEADLCTRYTKAVTEATHEIIKIGTFHSLGTPTLKEVLWPF
jgi:hypothetical protein